MSTRPRGARRPIVAPRGSRCGRACSLAVAIVALVGLIVADVATYAALRSFLIDRIDSSLDYANRPLASLVYRQSGSPGGLRPDAARSGGARRGGPGRVRRGARRRTNRALVASGSTRAATRPRSRTSRAASPVSTARTTSGT